MTLLLRLLLWTAPRLMLGLALWRALTGRETWADFAERRGAVGPNGAIWVHGASNGELTSARWVIEALAAEHPVHVTASTVTGRALVRQSLPGVTTSLAPLDLPGALRRFGRPRAFVNLEGEFWPARFRHLQGLPIALVGARMSRRSARFWGGAGAGFLSHVTLASAQDAGSEARLRALGVSGWLPPCDLKAEAMARSRLAPPRPRAERAGVLLAASTHAGEDGPLLDAFMASDFTLLIIAPRHPRRGDEIASLIAARGLAFSRRSAGAGIPLTPGKRVYLADTLGEMPLWYAMAGACFVGGSLVDKGGHTPWEPLAHGAAILHGPHVANFAATYAGLDAVGGARVWGPEALRGLDGATQDRMAEAARSLSTTAGGEALLTALRAAILGPERKK
ncbi:3-deoxy-D-manno-octulosonic acid transferase [Stagnihabitans tardus]|uniref:3-deoxy-D-manno-octulosonic acid transferase n=1 Tax=Stagnihabitans tardus TaxID=2699202 RepID=A0AAE5BTR9_9RHOB|nr:glycosyltransferase N-terminal domain-containing protein [Stagnihabitans tardus]NBZ87006.1 3-deoxy-D-manno-octulosonic acid transferase [Stagnihabitans tardus]